MPKRKRIAEATEVAELAVASFDIPPHSTVPAAPVPTPGRRANTRKPSQPVPASIDPNPNTNDAIQDGKDALRASPDAQSQPDPPITAKVNKKKSKPAEDPATPKKEEKALTNEAVSGGKNNAAQADDPEAEMEDDADPEELKEALSRPPPVNSSYLPLPWKGRLGYACLNTYLRAANPPVFSSRTCRIASILEHRHPLQDPTQPEHSTKNRPDKSKPADIARGQAYVEALGVANAKDIVKMLRWNDKYGIKFLRLSSEMFPFASHDIYGYTLAPFASEVLAEAGKVAAELGHRLTTHPGQFTQLGSPRNEVITASIRDLDYHCELLDLLKLPEQQDRDAVMILHMGGVFGDKNATIARFKENYVKLHERVKRRLVLENDDVCYTVHDLLPVCEELNIPLVLDYHHHNILFDADQIREGTLDIMNLYERIKATWDRKGITQKMHYSEPLPSAITARQRRRHNPRVATLPPCSPTMDLMIEAKDKEQAVFELMRTFKLPGFETFSDILPYQRADENKPWKPPKKKTPKKKKGVDLDEDLEVEDEPQPPPIVPDEEVGMGGSEGRVYWPPGMEEWLRPKKREVKPRDPTKAKTTAEKAAERRAEKAAWQAAREASAEARGTDGSLIKTDDDNVSELSTAPPLDLEKTKSVYNQTKPKAAGKAKPKPVRAPKLSKKIIDTKNVLTPSTSDHDDFDESMEDEEDLEMPDLTDAEEKPRAIQQKGSKRNKPVRTQSGRSAKRKAVNYADEDEDQDD